VLERRFFFDESGHANDTLVIFTSDNALGRVLGFLRTFRVCRSKGTLPQTIISAA